MMSNLLISLACTASWIADFWLLTDFGINGGLL
ncbi:hypothetical protein ABMA09_23005 [Erwinia rhapontici]